MDKILKYSTLIYSFLLFIGYSYIHTYYRHFGIEIFSFLDASEILLSFLNNLAMLIFIILFILLFYGLPYFFLSQLETTLPKKETTIAEKKDSLLKSLIIPISFTIYGIFQLVKMIIDGPIVSLFAFIYIIVGVISFLVYKYLPKFLEKKQMKIKLSLVNITLIIIVICTFNYLTAIFESNQVEKKIHQTLISFEINSTKIQSSDSVIFIGATSKYIFLKNLNSQANYIYQKANIGSLSLIKMKEDPK